MQEKPIILHLKDIKKSYGNKIVLDDIDLTVRKGELVTLVGPSGCGKSTLLKLILGQEFANSGSLQIENNEVSFPSPDRGIVFQKYGLYPNLTALQNVIIGKRLATPLWNRKKHQEIKKEGMEFLERVRLAGHAKKYPHELSGGMQQRVAIAQALIMRPKILLMDEPFGALDPGTREEMQLFLLELWEQENLTVFFVTHDLEEACFLSTRVLVLSQFYTDDRGAGHQRGARIVVDLPLHKEALSTKVKTSKNFNATIAQLRKEGFDPKYLQHAKDFNLTHKDSWSTLCAETHKKES